LVCRELHDGREATTFPRCALIGGMQETRHADWRDVSLEDSLPVRLSVFFVGQPYLLLNVSGCSNSDASPPFAVGVFLSWGRRCLER